MSPQSVFESFSPRTAWQAYFPLGANPWDGVKVAHLYRRAAFGVSWETIRRGVESTPDRLVAQLVEGGDGQAAFDEECGGLLEGALASGEPRQLKAVWLYRLLYSPHPLAERMTLFWHDHFATSNAKVNDLRLMQRQNDVLRRHALGHFGEMLQEITRDPAMMVWLDSQLNKKGRPNENYAREIFELFSLGVGRYSEKDIQEAARALTGWEVVDGRAVFFPEHHDDGEKTILGRTGRWAAGDVVRIALQQPACARFLVRKLFGELVSETVEPSEEMLAPLADGFRLRNYDIAWLVETILGSWVFYSPAAIGQKVKGPVDFAVGAVRMLAGRASPLELADLCDQLGQSLFYPPSVKGWDGGDAWLNSTTLLGRQNFAFDLTRGAGAAFRCDPARLVEAHNISGSENLARFFLELLLQNPGHEARPEIVAHLDRERGRLAAAFYPPLALDKHIARTAAHLVMTLPDFQLA